MHSIKNLGKLKDSQIADLFGMIDKLSKEFVKNQYLISK